MKRNTATFIFSIVLNALWSVEASSPVVLWTVKRIGEGNVESNLNEFSSTQFADLVAWKSEHGNIPVIAFGLNSLSLEDLTPQGSIGASEPFRKLRRITDASAETLLFPAVQSASDAISILQGKGFEVLQINAGDPLPKIENPSTIVVIMDKPSVNMDDEILRVFSKYTLEFPNLVGMLWGKQSTWSEQPEDEVNEVLTRRKRQSGVEPIFHYSDGKGLLVVFREVVLRIRDSSDASKWNKVSYTSATTTASSEMTSDSTILSLKFSESAPSVTTFAMNLTLTKDKLGYWKMSRATATLIGQSSNSTGVLLSSAVNQSIPIEKSFHCSKFGNFYQLKKPDEQTFTIAFTGFQLQAFVDPSKDQNVFLKDYECVGFFTPGIWMGIVVTLMLLSILTWGMKMIMDVKTMDRFDDPKGKPISFGTGE